MVSHDAPFILIPCTLCSGYLRNVNYSLMMMGHQVLQRQAFLIVRRLARTRPAPLAAAGGRWLSESLDRNVKLIHKRYLSNDILFLPAEDSPG